MQAELLMDVVISEERPLRCARASIIKGLFLFSLTVFTVFVFVVGLRMCSEDTFPLHRAYQTLIGLFVDSEVPVLLPTPLIVLPLLRYQGNLLFSL